MYSFSAIIGLSLPSAMTTSGPTVLRGAVPVYTVVNLLRTRVPYRVANLVRPLTAQLKREDRVVNAKAVRRILKELGLQHKVGQVRIRTTDSNHPHWCYPNLVQGWRPIRPDSVWVADVTHPSFVSLEAERLADVIQ